MAQHKNNDLPDVPEADAYADVTEHELEQAEASGQNEDEGHPYLDDANPFGRSLPNQQNHPMGGAGTWKDPQKRVSHEQPGVDAANPLPQALDAQPRRAPEE
jgi:hypothetical protein